MRCNISASLSQAMCYCYTQNMGFASEPPKSRGSGLSSLAIRGQMQKIFASEMFSRSERLTAFLRFTVEETLAGRGNTLKEQVIAATIYPDRPVLRDGTLELNTVNRDPEQFVEPNRLDLTR
jgi:hypothetical protein